MQQRETPVPHISAAEWLVMRYLWANQPATAKDVVAALEPQTRWNAKTIDLRR